MARSLQPPFLTPGARMTWVQRKLPQTILIPPIKILDRYASSQICTLYKTKLFSSFTRSGFFWAQRGRHTKYVLHETIILSETDWFLCAEVNCWPEILVFEKKSDFVCYFGYSVRDPSSHVRMGLRSLLDPLNNYFCQYIEMKLPIIAYCLLDSLLDCLLNAL